MILYLVCQLRVTLVMHVPRDHLARCIVRLDHIAHLSLKILNHAIQDLYVLMDQLFSQIVQKDITAQMN